VPAADGGPPPSGFRQWVRHHTASLISTAVDFIVMVACVELLAVRSVPATIVGALCGAVTNFTLGRRFIYPGAERPVAPAAWRYVLVSAVGLALNALGEHLLNNVLGVQYLLARLITSVLVSNGWNYPLQRFFVFSPRTATRA
jgi:putative flippase GtrA